MKCLFFCPRWGSENIPWPDFISEVKTAGFDGIELGLPIDKKEANLILSLIRDHGLLSILQHYETTEKSFDRHKNIYSGHIDRLAREKPFAINSHTGRDFFSFEENVELLEYAASIATSYGISITHETHRSRFSYAAHSTKPYLKFDWLKFTWDVSHWFCVSESLLFDQVETLNDFIFKVDHLHARFGYTQGPQIDRPFEQRWKAVIQRHVDLWDRVAQSCNKRQQEFLPITTEFGPWPYLVNPPADLSNQAYLFERNKEMLNFLKSKYHFTNDNYPKQ